MGGQGEDTVALIAAIWIDAVHNANRPDFVKSSGQAAGVPSGY
jgi:hypothetical protein